MSQCGRDISAKWQCGWHNAVVIIVLNLVSSCKHTSLQVCCSCDEVRADRNTLAMYSLSPLWLFCPFVKTQFGVVWPINLHLKVCFDATASARMLVWVTSMSNTIWAAVCQQRLIVCQALVWCWPIHLNHEVIWCMCKWVKDACLASEHNLSCSISEKGATVVCATK